MVRAMPPPRPPGSPTPSGPPDEAALYEAAVTHLARYATSAAGLLRVLDRRVDRWARAVSENHDDPEALARATDSAKQAARRAVARLVALGALDDGQFARTRAASLARAGRSRRAVAAHLAARGIAAETARAALPDDPEREFAAAIAQCRRRRLGPFRTAEPTPELRRRELAALARAGFDQETAQRALRFARDAAEELLLQVRRG